jgi:hypothetical protein
MERVEAKALGAIKYYTGRPCKHGHVTDRFTASGSCSECLTVSSNKRHEANPERRHQYHEKHYAKNKARCVARARVYNEAHPEKLHEAVRNWAKNNRSAITANAAKRKGQKANATPVWADLDLVKAFYLEAERLTHETGVEHHVDHIFPLQGENSCGLHVETNLQVLPWKENLQKSNKMPAFIVEDGKMIILQSI